MSEFDSIAHAGVKGMKWGVRKKSRDRSGNSADYAASRATKRKKLSQMSNSELNALNNRLQLERTNKELRSTGALRKIKVGTAAVGAVIAIGTTANTAMKVANGPAGELVKKLLSRG